MPLYKFYNDGVWNAARRMPMNAWRAQRLVDLLRRQGAVVDGVRHEHPAPTARVYDWCSRSLHYTRPNPQRTCTWDTDDIVNYKRPAAISGPDWGTIEVEFHFEP